MATDLDDQQRILSEVSHDLANRFHRSYYFIDLLGEALGPEEGNAGSLLESLRLSVEDIEAMARATLEYMRPLELRKLTVRMEDLAASLRQHAGLRSIEIRGDTAAARREVDVDPSRISQALAVLCKAAIAGDESQAPLVVEFIDGDQVGLRIHRASAATGPMPTGITLALTARIARLHGGAVDLDDGPAASLTLRLPASSRES